MLRSKLIVALGVSTALTVCGAASAAGYEASDQASVVVRTDDVNLHAPAGARLMALRIHNAAATACGGDVAPVAVRLSEGFIHCREAAIDRAVRDLNTPMVAEALGRAQHQMLSRGD
jgi:UrcA family protein